MDTDSSGIWGVSLAMAVILIALVLKWFKFRNFVKITEFLAVSSAIFGLILWPMLHAKNVSVSSCFMVAAMTLICGLLSFLILLGRGKSDM